MRNISLHLPLVLLIFVTACSESTVFTNSGDAVLDDAVPTDKPIDYQGPDDYDLSLYFFHANTQSAGGEIALTEKYYEKSPGNSLIYSRARRYQNTGTNINSLGSDNTVLLQYNITINSIKEIGVGYNGNYGSPRFAELKEAYKNNVFIEDLGRKDTCTLQNHLDNFDLGSATGAATIITGVYEDVLHVFCNRVLDSADIDPRTNFSWNGYYAKGVGLIFADGNLVILDDDSNWLVVGNSYLIPEY